MWDDNVALLHSSRLSHYERADDLVNVEGSVDEVVDVVIGSLNG